MRANEAAEAQLTGLVDSGIKDTRACLDSARAYLVLALQSLDSTDEKGHLAARCQELIDAIDGE